MTKIARQTAKRKCIETAKAHGIETGKFHSLVQLRRGFPNGQLWTAEFHDWDGARIWIEIVVAGSAISGTPLPWSEVHLPGYVDLQVKMMDEDYECYRGSLADLFADWRSNGSNALEQVGEPEDKIREDLRRDGKYRIYGFVGCYFDLTVVEEAA